MLINIISDIHLDVNSELVSREIFDLGKNTINIFAGDITPDIDEKIRFFKSFSGKVVFVNGNHDYYSDCLNYEDIIDLTRQKISRYGTNNIVFLENDVVFIENLRIIGCTLWVDFDLYGTKEYSKYIAIKNINDFKNILTKNKLLTPDDVEQIHFKSRNFIENQLKIDWHGKTIIVTHHSPHAASISPRFLSSNLNPSYASNLEFLINKYSPTLWIHGHIHNFFDGMIGNTRLISNPYGYDHENTFYKYPFVIEI